MWRQPFANPDPPPARAFRQLRMLSVLHVKMALRLRPPCEDGAEAVMVMRCHGAVNLQVSLSSPGSITHAASLRTQYSPWLRCVGVCVWHEGIVARAVSLPLSESVPFIHMKGLHRRWPAESLTAGALARAQSNIYLRRVRHLIQDRSGRNNRTDK